MQRCLLIACTWREEPEPWQASECTCRGREGPGTCCISCLVSCLISCLPAKGAIGTALPWSAGREPDAGVAFAVATDDGAVRIFHMEPGSPGLQYARTMPRIESRALSAAWHPSGSVLLAGYGDGCLRAWHVPSAREILRISAGWLLARIFCFTPVFPRAIFTQTWSSLPFVSAVLDHSIYKPHPFSLAGSLQSSPMYIRTLVLAPWLSRWSSI